MAKNALKQNVPAKPARRKAAAAGDRMSALLIADVGTPGPLARPGTELQDWSFTISDFHRTTPEVEHRAYLSGIEIPVFKHLERLKYAAAWGLDPGYVVVS